MFIFLLVSPLEQFDTMKLFSIFFFKSDLSFFHVLLPFLFINMLIMIYMFFFKDEYKLIPDVWQYMFENVYIFVFNLMKTHVGQKGYIYLPFIFIMFNFVLLLNLCGLMPFGVALTSYAVLILFLTMTMCSSIFMMGLLTQQLNFLKIFIPKSPFLLLLLLIPMEMFSYFISMFSLGMSLVANILAGHTLVYMLSTFMLKLLTIQSLMSFLAMLILLLMMGLEFGMALLQAYVFTTLMCIYLSDSVNMKEGH